VSTEPVSPVAHVRSTTVGAHQLASGAPIAADDALEFVRFCYRRRRVGWPGLYDEMVAVAARGAFRGLGYGDLAERGISFCLADLPRLVALTERVVREEQPVAEPRPGTATLSLAPAQS
jgi:hypothetical protein